MNMFSSVVLATILFFKLTSGADFPATASQNDAEGTTATPVSAVEDNEEESFKALNCDFSNKNYEYNRFFTNAQNQKQKLNFAPPVKSSLKFESAKEYNEFLKAVSHINEDVLESTTYNSFDDLINFYAKYKSFKVSNEDANPNIYKVLSEYTGIFNPSSPAGITINLLNRVFEKYPEAEASSYLVNVGSFIRREAFNALVNEEGYKTDRVAGTIKVSIKTNADKYEDGYLLLDPSVGKPPLLFRPSNEIVVNTKKEPFNSVVLQFGSTKYYTPQPFCAFLESSKASGVKLYHSAVAKNRQGNPQAFVDVKLIANGNPNFSPYIALNDVQGRKRTKLYLHGDDYKDFLDEDILTSVLVQLNISKEKLFEYRDALAEIDNDKPFKIQAAHVYASLRFKQSFDLPVQAILKTIKAERDLDYVKKTSRNFNLNLRTVLENARRVNEANAIRVEEVNSEDEEEHEEEVEEEQVAAEVESEEVETVQPAQASA